MIVIRDGSPHPAAIKGCVLALGNFDGLHLGHQAVIGRARELAQKHGVPLAVMTFEPHPRRVFKPELPPLRILPLREKIRLLSKMGVEYLRIVRFSKRFAQTTAEDFVTHMLHQELGVSHVVTGDDFTFGHNREGNAAYLQSLASKLGFAAVACAQLDVGGERCSSTRIRDVLAAGDVAGAAKLLGWPYALSGPVRHGDKRGQVLGFATANILPPPIFLPKLGIYAVRVHVAGKPVKGVASLGVRPNYPLQKPLLEVHLLDWQGDLYGQKLDVEFVQYLRPEQKFDSEEALKTQMAQDCAQARKV